MITTNTQTPSEDEPHGGRAGNTGGPSSGATSGARAVEGPPSEGPTAEGGPAGSGHHPTRDHHRGGPGHRTLDDDDLVRRAQQGDLQSFEELVRRHQSTMYRLAFRILGDQGRAEDAVQDSFVSVWRRLGSFRSDAKFTSWLYRIVTNRCLNVARSHRPTTPLDDGGARLEARGGDGPERTALRQEQLAALRAAIAALPPSQRACWLLREQEGLGYEEIADAVGSTPVAVRGRIHRARTSIAEAMQPWR